MINDKVGPRVRLPPPAKGVKVDGPRPYKGEDNIETFTVFMQAVLRWMRMARLIGPDYDGDRVTMLGQYLEGPAIEWYNQVVESPYRYQRDWNFEGILCALFQRFVHRANEKKAVHKYKAV